MEGRGGGALCTEAGTEEEEEEDIQLLSTLLCLRAARRKSRSRYNSHINKKHNTKQP